MIGTLVRQAEAHGIDSVISTGDKDLAQLISPNVTLVNTMSNEMLDDRQRRSPNSACVPIRSSTCSRSPATPSTTCRACPRSDRRPRRNGSPSTARSTTSSRTRAKSAASSAKTCARRSLGCRKASVCSPFSTDCELPVAPSDLMSARGRCSEAQVAVRAFRVQELGQGSRQRRAERVVADRRKRPAAIATRAASAPARSRRVGTNWCSMSPLSSGCSARSPRQRWSASTPRLQDSIRCRRESSDSSFSIEPGRASYVPLAHPMQAHRRSFRFEHVLSRLKPWFEDANAKKLGQNVKYDQHVLANHGIALAGVAHDTLLQSYVLESHRPHDMDNLAWRYLDVEDDHLRRRRRQGREPDRVRSGRDRASDRIFRRGCRHHAAACTGVLQPQDCGRSQAGFRLSQRSKCRRARCCFAWSATAC